MKKVILGTAILLLITSVSYCQDSKQPLALTIKSDKEMYKVGEEIKISAILSNKSDKEIVMLWDDGRVVLEADKFGCVIASIPAGYDNKFTYMWIKLQDILRKKVAIENNLMPGIYKLTLQYKYNDFGKLGFGLEMQLRLNQRFWSDDITSNAITIEVREKGKVRQRVTTQSNNLDKEIVESWGRQKDFFVEKNFAIIDWQDAKEILLSRKVRGGKQYHTGWLTIYTLDDDKYLTKQPNMDALWQFMQEYNLNIEGFGTE